MRHLSLPQRPPITLHATLIVVMTLFGCSACQSSKARIESSKSELTVVNSSGLRLQVIGNRSPMLRILLPQQSEADRGIEVMFPEHITARQHGKTDAEHLYLSSRSSQAFRPNWKHVDNYLEYETDLPPGVHVQSRATLEDD